MKIKSQAHEVSTVTLQQQRQHGPMENYYPDSSGAPAGGRSPTRRKMRSKSGTGGHKAKDPVLELIMCDLMQRQSISYSGAVVSSSGAKDAVHVPVSQVITHQPYSTAGNLNPASGVGHASGSARGCCCGLWQKRWFKILVLLLATAAVVLAVALPVGLTRAAAARRRMQPPQHALGPRLNTSGMTLVFADDFTSLDTTVWNYDIGDGSDYGLQSWGNNELQCYTASSNNVDVIPHPEYPQDDGVLRIRSVYSEQPLQCANRIAPNSTRQWTSGKLDTKNKVSFTWSGQQTYWGSYAGQAPTGRKRALLADPAVAGGLGLSSNASSSSRGTCGRIVVESRMKLPVAAGRWSALWMMPLPRPCPQGVKAAECGAFGVWPRSGEIDIVEQVNTDAEVLGTIHFADAGGNHRYTGDKLALSETALLDWNIFQLVWNCTSIGWYVNSQQINQVTKQDLGDAVWPFDEPFFLILNTAIGGWLTGNVAPDKGQTRPLMVDYVRVYAAPS